uniref:CMP-N-acetylneuraminate-beta-galactosamide-alpha-2,3-sialyltransferase 1 n=1 Tax=Oncorhynchus mykiss TaxID=8022 RepID=A0A8K9UIA8_ONCMY
MILFRIRKVRRVIVLLCITTIVVFYTGQLSSNSLVDFVKNALRPLDRILSPKYCACLKCMTQPDDDLWFQKRFNTSFQPFLTRKYKTLSNDTRMWWQKLQKDRNIANFSEVVEKLFQVIPDADLYMDAGPERCRTCAVVGNSGNLKGSHYGALIDSSDVIIRMNKARTSGYERDVGSRTTHHIIYPESAIDLDNTTSLLFFPFKTLDLQWLPGAITTGPSICYTMHFSKITLKLWIKFWLDYYGKYPSTGFMALILALHICDEVNVYGFGKDRNGNWHHYWETLTNKKLKTGPHPGDYEYNVTRKLSEIHKLEIYKGW